VVRLNKTAVIFVSLLCSLIAQAINAQDNVAPALSNDEANDEANNEAIDEASSDLLIVLDSDGRSYTVQHTIATNGPAIQLRLPGSVVPLEVLFFGPEQNTLSEQYNVNPNLIALSSGSAFARYQHQYGVEVQQIRSDQFVLTTPSVPDNIELKDATLSHSSTTWVFPSEYELVSYTVTEPSTGRWVTVNNTLTFHQVSTEPVKLSINYKRNAPNFESLEATCGDGSIPSDGCSKDTDKDGVPDYRDICVSKIGSNSNSLGCEQNKGMLLDAVVFQTGRSYLDANARQWLDRVAQALLRNEDQYFEISAHTDNVGAAAKNERLSEKRADAVRHYLLLRGVNPNSVRAVGYGEKYPIRDNASGDGRRANRRVELIAIE